MALAQIRKPILKFTPTMMAHCQIHQCLGQQIFITPVNTSFKIAAYKAAQIPA
jgi:hypothetical protein